MDNNLLKQWLQAEKEQESFSGWDFSRIEAQWENEALPWSYEDTVKKYMKPDDFLLDMGTGGGELLLSFGHPYHLTSVTEGWQKNYELLLEKIRPLGVKVVFVPEDDSLDFPDNSFDIILNHHESFDAKEVQRVLKPNGIFITQQVGAENGRMLAEKLYDDYLPPFPEGTLETLKKHLQEAGFSIVYEEEYFPYQVFFTMESLIYYVKTISWEYPNFSVKEKIPALLNLKKELDTAGKIHNQEHRFILVAKLK